ncbi:DUF1007 family protein [Pantoea sp. Mb-10]|uniref:DUF1007 family protein n=1 Tax=unclassified Pantoea TaxID=2630326 RepID=UPI001E57C1BF|nr:MULTISPECIES: DUF1007 family protein [unclassified Pantoea]MCE0489171.1 DUF1007 family protein [Pantoea sp. Mb-10]MCE0503080.1 DUF1007 family protein [Pantoea sp. Pb-8]
MKIALTALMLVISTSAWSHPHSFIAMKTEFIGDNDRLTGMKMVWTMDEITSADLLYDAGHAKPGDVVWKKLAAQVMANVLGQHYFTEVWQGQNRIKFLNLPKEYNLSRSGNKAVLEFIVPFGEPPTLSQRAYRIQTFDPSYFVDMSYENAQNLSMDETVKAHCQMTLHTPKPADSLKQYALSLDKADAPPEQMDLGQQFAQTVTLACH